jgi:hypothetical protein
VCIYVYAAGEDAEVRWNIAVICIYMSDYYYTIYVSSCQYMSSAAEEDAEVRRNIAVILARQGAMEVLIFLALLLQKYEY